MSGLFLYYMAKNHKNLDRLLEKVFHERGFDFREYRESTLRRRIGRRLRACGVDTYADYARALDRNPEEYEHLFNDLTINITSFFRDDVAFNALKEEALKELIKRNTRKQRALRFWSAGCATGEESYSIAILLLEMLGSEIKKWDITIIATDIDNRALQRAQDGYFISEEIKSIKPALRRRYFLREAEGFRVKPGLKELLTFRIHNLVSDKPYKEIDLVVCRNVLIYLKPTLQMHVLNSFHDSLKNKGFLLLGKAEIPVGETKELFTCVDRKGKLFRKN